MIITKDNIIQTTRVTKVKLIITTQVILACPPQSGMQIGIQIMKEGMATNLMVGATGGTIQEVVDMEGSMTEIIITEIIMTEVKTIEIVKKATKEREMEINTGSYT